MKSFKDQLDVLQSCLDYLMADLLFESRHSKPQLLVDTEVVWGATIGMFDFDPLTGII